jgi:hypothetical protein
LGFFSSKNENDEYIKCIGLYDNDIKGSKAIDDYIRTVGHSSAESKCAKTIKYIQSYAKHLIPIYKKGIQLPITLEEMFEYEHWRHAKDHSWLVERNNVDLLLKDPAGWNKMSMSLLKYIQSIGLDEKECLYLSKLKMSINKIFVSIF